MFTSIPPLRARIVGTKFGTLESIFRRSRGSRPCSEHKRDFLKTPEVEVADPEESKMVQRSMMSGDNWVVPRPVNGGGRADWGGEGEEVGEPDVVGREETFRWRGVE